MSYAILRFEKRKGSSGQTGGIEKHHERKKDKYISNMDIDTSRSHLNYHLIKPIEKYSKEINSRIENAGCRVRKDSIKFIDTIITSSAEFFENHSLEEQKNYFNHALDFIKQNIGEENIFSAVVHMDEKTPHMHLCFTPITKDGRLSAKEIIGNRAKLIEWQDKNKSSFRTLPLIPVVEQLLLEAKGKQANYHRLFGKDYCKEYLDYVCVDELGVLIRPTYVTDHFGTFLKQHKLKKIRFHDLRHSCASLLLANKIPMKAIQEWLGHSTFATTADTYSHLDFQSKIASANVIADLFSGSEVAVL